MIIVARCWSESRRLVRDPPRWSQEYLTEHSVYIGDIDRWETRQDRKSRQKNRDFLVMTLFSDVFAWRFIRDMGHDFPRSHTSLSSVETDNKSHITHTKLCMTVTEFLRVTFDCSNHLWTWLQWWKNVLRVNLSSCTLAVAIEFSIVSSKRRFAHSGFRSVKPAWACVVSHLLQWNLFLFQGRHWYLMRRWYRIPLDILIRCMNEESEVSIVGSLFSFLDQANHPGILDTTTTRINVVFPGVESCSQSRDGMSRNVVTCCRNFLQIRVGTRLSADEPVDHASVRSILRKFKSSDDVDVPLSFHVFSWTCRKKSSTTRRSKIFVSKCYRMSVHVIRMFRHQTHWYWLFVFCSLRSCPRFDFSVFRIVDFAGSNHCWKTFLTLLHHSWVVGLCVVIWQSRRNAFFTRSKKSNQFSDEWHLKRVNLLCDIFEWSPGWKYGKSEMNTDPPNEMDFINEFWFALAACHLDHVLQWTIWWIAWILSDHSAVHILNLVSVLMILQALSKNKAK